MRYTVLIPTCRETEGEAEPVSDAEMQAIIDRFWSQFGGATVEGRTEGYWVDGGKLYTDVCVKLMVHTDASRMADLDALVLEIGRQLNQKAMFTEVELSDNVRILRVAD